MQAVAVRRAKQAKAEAKARRDKAALSRLADAASSFRDRRKLEEDAAKAALNRKTLLLVQRDEEPKAWPTG